MSMALKLILFIVLSYLVPYLLGMLFTFFSKNRDNRLSKNLLCGYMLLWSILQFITIPAIFMKLRFSVYAIAVYILLFIAVALSLLLNRKRFKRVMRETIAWLKSKPWLTFLVILLIAVQTAYISLAFLSDHDDAFYVGTAETALETDLIMERSPYTGDTYGEFPARYVLSPFPIFIALLSKVLNVRAAVTAHTLLPLVLIPLAYMVWYLMGNVLFAKDKHKTAVFLLMVMSILIFSGYSIYNQGMFMHVRIWQGKATLASILLPFVFCQSLNIIQKSMTKNDWVLLFFTMLSCCFASSMGIMLAAIMLGVTAISDAVIHKSIKNWKNILLCCVPNMIFAVIYIFIR